MDTNIKTLLAGRRSFVTGAALTAARGFVCGKWLSQTATHGAETSRASLPTDAGPEWQKTWDSATSIVAGNIHVTPHFQEPVLFEGSTYQGIWQECGPHESLVYAALQAYIGTGDAARIDVARSSHRTFFALQLPDGQLPASVKMSSVGYGQIQMVVPIAATAWEVAQLTKDEKFLSEAYNACSRWDLWLRRYRDTRATGLVEGFCTYDTGHDNSPRWAGIPNRCPDADAKKCPLIPSMPRLCPDLSATVYGGRIALAGMATTLGRKNEAVRWLADAEKIRRLIIERLYCPEDASFYDVDAQDKFVKVRSDVISRVLGEHVLDLDHRQDRAIFEGVWERQVHNPSSFWATYPLSSIAQDDPKFVRPIPRNSWGGASQALTALRAPRWMTHYGKAKELNELMQRWCEAIMRHGEFRQQIDPATGDFTQPDPGGYSPTALVFLDFARRLGMRKATVL